MATTTQSGVGSEARPGRSCIVTSRESEHGRLPVRSADDLQANGQLVLGEAAWDRDGRITGVVGPIPEESASRLVEAATKAPSGGNSQPWAFIAVRDDDLLKQMAVFARRGFQHMYDQVAARSKPGDPPLFPRLRPMIEALDQIPLVIVACLADAPGHYSSIHPAVQNLLLAARALGIGAVLTTGWAIPYAEEIRALLKLPHHVEPVAYIPLGYPGKDHYGPTTRRPVDEVLHWNGWADGKANSAAVVHR